MRALSSLAISAGLLVGACGGQMRDVTPRTSFVDGDGDAIIVLRVTPRAWITLDRGTYGQYGFVSKGVGSQFWAEDGFIVAKVTPTVKDAEAFAVTHIRPERFTSLADEPAPTYATAMWSPARVSNALAYKAVTECPTYTPKGEAKMPVFRAASGKVNYVGAIRVDASMNLETKEVPDEIAITPVASPDGVKSVAKLLAEQYPKVRAPIVAGRIQMMRWNEFRDF